MTDDELIAALREEDAYNERFYETDPLHKLSADRIELLVGALREIRRAAEASGGVADFYVTLANRALTEA